MRYEPEGVLGFQREVSLKGGVLGSSEDERDTSDRFPTETTDAKGRARKRYRDANVATPYLLDGDESHLSIRAFTPAMEREAFDRQGGVCLRCNKKFKIGEMDGDPILRKPVKR